MLGSIAGDIIGSTHEHAETKTKDFPLFMHGSTFTDDSVLSVAVADAILQGTSYAQAVHRWARRYPDAGYGGYFRRWIASEQPRAYGSFGNGSAMRVAAIGFAFDDEARVLDEARRSAIISHDHPEGIKGAQAVALAVFLARTGCGKEDLRDTLASRFGYDLDRTVDDIRPGYGFDVTCQGSVPEAILSFLDSTSYEDAVRNAISLGGDADTLACMAGGIAEAWYGGVPGTIAEEALARLDAPLVDVVMAFRERFACP